MSPFQTAILSLALCSLPIVIAFWLVVRPLRTEAGLPQEVKSRSRTHRRAVALGLILIACSLVCLVEGAGAVHTATRSKNWPQTQGLVLHSGYWRRSLADAQQEYIITIRYEYRVGNKTFTSDSIGWTSRFDVVNFRQQAEDVVARFPPGAKVTVFYNPEDPQQSALDPGSGIGPFGIGLGVLLLALGAYSLWWGFSEHRGSLAA